MKRISKFRPNFLLILFFLSFIIAGCPNPNLDPDSDPVIPMVLTMNVTTISANSVASGGFVLFEGNETVTTRGVCWNTTPGPTILNSKTPDPNGGTGNFTSSVTGLTSGTVYYLRAYATNIIGTAYGNEISFTTTALLPTITTTAVTSITSSTAISGGNITNDGGALVTARGVCWSTTTLPTIANYLTSSGTGAGSFPSAVAGLTPGTVYYLRAYATNSVGTAYGQQVSFTAISSFPIVYIGSSNGNIYALNAITGTLIWNFVSTASFAYSSPCYAKGLVYAGGIDNNAYAFDAVTGSIRWQRTIATIGIEADPFFLDGTLYIGTNDDYLHALDGSSGQPRWNFHTGGNVSSSPTASNGVVYFGSSDGKLYALYTSTGLLKWNYQTGAMINQSAPALVNGVVYVGSRDCYLYAINANDGTLIWRYNANGISLEHSSPAVANGIVYIGGWYNSNFSIGGNLYAVNATNGQLVWEKLLNSGISSSPCVANGKVYVTCDDNKIHALDAATGASIWEKTIMANSASPVVSNTIVYVGGGGTGFFYALDAQTGAEIWRFPTPNGLMTSRPLVLYGL